jgi:hypothetical protein
LIVAAAVAVAVAVASSKSGGSSKSSGSNPLATERVRANPSVGGQPANPSPVTPRAPVRGESATGESHALHEHGSGSGGYGGSNVYVGVGIPLGGPASYGGSGEDGSTGVVSTGVVSVAPQAVYPHTDLAPVFTEDQARRASLAPFLRATGSVCAVGNQQCFGISAMGGVSVAEFFEFSLGLMVDSGDRKSNSAFARPMGVVGIGLNGVVPKARSFALYFGSTLATDGSDYRIDPSLGLRIKPSDRWTLGIYPLSLAYRSASGQASWSPGLELGTMF